jgi:hypothetical protein
VLPSTVTAEQSRGGPLPTVDIRVKINFFPQRTFLKPHHTSLQNYWTYINRDCDDESGAAVDNPLAADVRELSRVDISLLALKAPEAPSEQVGTFFTPSRCVLCWVLGLFTQRR